MVRAQQVEEHGHASACNPRGVTDSEEFLDADGEQGAAHRLVLQPVPLTRGEVDLCRGEPLDFGDPVVSDEGVQMRCPVGRLHFVK